MGKPNAAVPGLGVEPGGREAAPYGSRTKALVCSVDPVSLGRVWWKKKKKRMIVFVTDKKPDLGHDESLAAVLVNRGDPEALVVMRDFGPLLTVCC